MSNINVTASSSLVKGKPYKLEFKELLLNIQLLIVTLKSIRDSTFPYSLMTLANRCVWLVQHTVNIILSY